KAAVSRRPSSFPWKFWELLLVWSPTFLPCPQWAQDLDGQWVLRLQGPAFLPTATGYWLGPGKGALLGKVPCSTSTTLRPVRGVPDRTPSSLVKCPCSSSVSTPWIFPPQKYNADYDLSARQGADTLAFMSLLEEKLLPVLVHTFWIDTKNYVEVTRKWYAEAMPFPLNFFLPGRMQRQYMERLELLSGEHMPEDEEELEKEVALRPGAVV
uniref:Mitochondrial outer membrane transport complex Sam37/metaxin N-terminal domain-containing protein n=1 Tax=Macaca mulatta TaxID=9544 RepID=A0A5F8A0I8_MACMU